MPNRVRINRGHVKIGHMQRINKNNSKTAEKLNLYGSGMDTESNLNKLRGSLRALSISGKKPKYISF